MRKTLAARVAAVWLGVTLPAAARADDSHEERWGTSLRGGTAVGYAVFGDDRVTTLGGQIALGYKEGPIAVEAEYEHLSLLEYRSGNNVRRGTMGRLGVNGRFYFARFGRGEDPDSLLLLWLEGGLGRQSGRFSTGDEFKRHDASAGAGWILDHRVHRRYSELPFNYVGWHFGWRLMASRSARHGPSFLAACRARGGGCPEMELGPGYDVGLMVASSLTFSW